jgi:adenine deaminase
VIGLTDGQLVTESLQAKAEEIENSDIAYLAVAERHGKKGSIGLGFVKGLGIQQGAIASTVAHDHHNLILAGKSLEDMLFAARELEKIGGGLLAACKKQVLASVPLPIGGLMSNETAKEITKTLHHLDANVKKLGISIHAPFMALSFLALSVIPHLKLTDLGLVDVDQFQLVGLEV